MTTNGSSATTSVHFAGTDWRQPWPSCEVHPIFVPTLAAIEEDEPLTVQRMKRVRDPHPTLIVGHHL